MAVVITLVTLGNAWAGRKSSALPALTGTVKDALGRPLGGVIVNLQDPNGRTVADTKTGAEGEFRLPERKAGTYALVTRRKGFRPATMIIALPMRAAKPLDLVLASEEPLEMRLSANRIQVQNALTETGASKYTQLLNSQFAKSVSLADGILPPRYGYRTAGVVESRPRTDATAATTGFRYMAASAILYGQVSSSRDARTN